MLLQMLFSQWLKAMTPKSAVSLLVILWQALLVACFQDVLPSACDWLGQWRKLFFLPQACIVCMFMAIILLHCPKHKGITNPYSWIIAIWTDLLFHYEFKYAPQNPKTMKTYHCPNTMWLHCKCAVVLGEKMLDYSCFVTIRLEAIL